MNGLTTIESKRRAVAPIIATLLMVAIAVVGGILIFVFTQGFFADEQVVGPTVDNIRIFGYSTEDNAVVGHSGFTMDECTTAAGNNLADGECIAVFIENLGDKPVAIQAVRIFGETHTAATTTGDCGANDNFSLMTAASTTVSILEPNTQATLCIDYDGSNSGSVKPGRTIPVQVETSNGQSSQINMINGATRGQQ